MTTDSVTAAALAKAKALYGAARAHKRAEAQHRREARALMRKLDEFRRELEARGIQLHIIDTDPEEGHSHG